MTKDDEIRRLNMELTDLKKLQLSEVNLNNYNSSKATVIDMIHEALVMNGGADYLSMQAQRNPREFMKLLGQTIPKQAKQAKQAELQTIPSNHNTWLVEFVEPKPQGLLKVPNFITDAEIIEETILGSG